MSTLLSKSAARLLAGYVSIANGKMPGSSYACDPFQCNTGSKLREVKGSTCSGCYSVNLWRIHPSVAQGYAKNQLMLETASIEDFVDGAVSQIVKAAKKTGQPYHRWFDGGDLPSVDALRRIVAVCLATPQIKHWLPTREVKFVREYLKNDVIPDNLTIRISSPMIDGAPIPGYTNTSTVHKNMVPEGHICPASRQGGKCGDCRACWAKNVSNVSYPFHR